MEPHNEQRQLEIRKGSLPISNKMSGQSLCVFRGAQWKNDATDGTQKGECTEADLLTVKDGDFAGAQLLGFYSTHIQKEVRMKQRIHVATLLIHQLLPLIAASRGEVKETSQCLPGCC